MAVTKNPKHTFNFDILLQTKLKQQDWRKHKQQLEDEFQNLQIGIQEGMAAESAQKVVDIFNQAFEKVNMPKIDVSALQSDLDNVAKSFTEALAKINNIDTSALKGIETTLGHISDTLDDIAPKVGQNVKKATKSAMLSVSQLDKMLAETGESIKEVEAALKFTGKGKRGSAKTGEIELSTVKELYKEYGKLTAEIKGIDTEEDKHWLARNQAMIKFVKAYEGLSKEVKAGLDDTTRESLKKAYDFAQPKANAARTNLQNLVDRRAGTFSEFREPWARESTLQDIKKILSDGISVKGDGKKSQAQLQAEIDREQSVIAETTGEIKSILENLQKNKTYVMYRGVNASESDKIQQRSDIYNSKDGYGAEYYINSKKIASKYAPDDDGSGHVISAEISPKHPILYDAKGKDYQDIITDQEFINWFKKQHKSFNNLDSSTKLSGSDANQLVMNQAARKAGFDAIIFDNVLDHPINDSTGEGTSKASELGRTIAVLSDNILKITGFFDVIDGKVSKEISKDRPYYYRMPDGQDVSEPTEEGLERAQLEKDLQEAERAKRRAEKNVKELQAQLQEAPTASGDAQGAQQEKVVIADGVATEETLGKILAVLEGQQGDGGEARRKELADQMELYDDDENAYSLEESEGQKAALQEILNSLKQEGLLTDELQTKYDAINAKIDERISLLKDVRLAYGILDEEGKIDYNPYDLESAQQALVKSKELLDSIPKRALDDDDIAIGVEDIQQQNIELEKRIGLLQQVKQGLIDIDSVDDIMSETGDLDSKLSRLGDVANAWGSKVKDVEADEDDDAIEKLQEFEAIYDRIILKLANGKKISILPNAKGLRALYKYDDGIDSGAYGETEIDDVEFVRKEMQQTSQVAAKAEQVESITQQHNADKEKTLKLLKEEYLSYEEILYLVKQYQSHTSEFETDIYDKLLRGNLTTKYLHNALSGVGISSEDGAKTLFGYQNAQLRQSYANELSPTSGWRSSYDSSAEEYEATQLQADAEQRTIELTRQKAEEEARITEEKQQQLELDKTVVESQKEKPKPLLPTADGLEAHTYAPSDEQKAYVLKLGEEYRAIMEILERGDSEFEAALIERAKAISKIMLETVRGSDGTIEHMYKDVYGGDAKTTSVLGDWRQKDRLLHNVDSNKIDESQRQAAIDLIYQELEAEKQLEAERLKAREAAKQRELDTFKSKYSSASEEEKKLLYEIIELEKEHRTLADIGDEESHKLALEALQKVREKYNALEKLNEDLLDAYDDVGFKRAAPYVDTPSIVAHPIEEDAIDTPEEQSHLSKLKDSVDGVTAAVKEKTQEFLNEKTAVKKSTQSEVHALGEVEKKVTAIRVALSNVNTLMNNIQKGNDISQLSDVKVTVNYPEQQDDYKQLVGQIKDAIGSPQEEKYDDDEDSQQVKHVADILTRIKVHTHNTVRQIRDNLIGNLETQFSNLKNNVYNVKIAHDDNDKQANKVAIDAEELEGVLRRVLTTTPADADSTDAENPNAKTQIDGLVAQYKRALATIAEWQTLYQSLDNLPSTNKPAEQRKYVLEAVNGISPELAHMIGGTFEEAFKTGFKGVKTKDIARQVSRIAEETMFGYVPEQVEMLQKLNVDNFDFDKLPIQKASIDALNPVFELLKQIDDIRKGEVDVGVDDQDDEMPETPKEAYALDSTLQEVKQVLDKIAANTASLNGVEIQRAVEKNTEATEGVAPEVAKETSTAVAEETNNVAKVIEKKRADSEGKINSEYANSKTVVRGQKTSDSYQTTKTHMVPEFDKETEEFKGYKTTLVEIIDDFDKIRKENIKAEKDLVRAQKKVSEFLAKFQSKTGGNAQYVEGFSDLQNMAKHIDASNIDLAYNKMIELQQKYAELERNFRKGQSSLNPFVNAINKSQNIGNIFGEVQDKFNGLVVKSDELTDNFNELKTLSEHIQDFTKLMETNPESIRPDDFTKFSKQMGEFTALKTQVDSMIRSEKAAEKDASAKSTERAKEIKDITTKYEKLGKLRAKFEGSGDLNDKEELKILAEKVAKTRESMNLTFEEIQLLRAKSDEAYKSELRLVEAAKKQKALDEQQKAAEKAAQDASKKTDKEAAKQAKKQAAEAKRAAKREAMFGKAGNAIGRAENLWMNAQGEDGLPENLIAQVDALYKKMGALRKEQDKVRNAETITKKQQKNLRNHTIEMNALTNEVSELFTEYQKLSGATVDETKTKATSLTSKSSLGDYENELKRYVKSIEGGKAQIKGFDAATRTLTYTVKTGKNEFTEYTAAVRRADGALVSVQGSTKRTETFLEATKRKMKELTSYMSGMALFSRATQELRRGIQYVREIDDALVELRKVTDETDESYDKFLRTAAKTGSVIGATISEVTEATATFSKLGYDMEMATEMAESAIVYKNVGDNIASAEDAADSIISTLKGFRLESSETMRIVDRFNEVGKSIAHVI